MSTWVVANSVVSPLGATAEENYRRCKAGESGITKVTDPLLSPHPFFAAQVATLPYDSTETRFEKLCSRATQSARGGMPLNADRTIYILSTTKGNIDLLESNDSEDPRLYLHNSAKRLASQAGLVNFTVVSNACISGVMALLVARRFLEAGVYDHAVVVGADILSRFVVSGFQSLSALSPAPCKPFDTLRDGTTLGEAAATIILSTKPDELHAKPTVVIAGGGLSNDANHISGPSRTGDELGFAITQALAEAHERPDTIDFVSAHGTATVFNDEMEAKAFEKSGLTSVPVNSLKGYFGHTLGAAGVLETAMSLQCLQRDEVLPTLGLDTPGVSGKITLSRKLTSIPLRTCLKTASGFGGCNAALVLRKEK